ncbi:MAG: hypothetical protein RSA08_04050 [Clostridia bacterium]
MKRKIYSIFILMLLFLTFTTSYINAGWFEEGSTWFGEVDKTPANVQGSTNINDIIKDFSNYINIAGTSIIVIVTIILGIKYIYGSSEGKAEVKNSLTTLIIACVFFFGWNTISTIFITNTNEFTLQANTFQDMMKKIFGTFVYIAQYFMIGSVIYVGVKYIFGGAEGKANFKAKSAQFILGIILAWSSVSFLTFVSNIIEDVF